MRKKLFLISVSLIVVSTALLYYFMTASFGTQADRIGYACGYLLGISLWWLLLAYIMWRWVFKKKKGLGFFCFSILFSLTCIYQIIQIREQIGYQAKAVGERAFVITELSHRLENPQMAVNTESTFSKKEFGDFATIFNVARRLAESYAEEEVKLQQAFDDLNINGILVPSTLGDKDGIIEARVRLKNFLQKINVIQSNAHAYAEKALEAVSTARFHDGYLKKEFARSFEGGIDKLNEITDTMYDLDREIVRNIDELLLFLQDIQAKYHLADGKLSFEAAEDQQKVEEKITHIAELASKEQGVSKKVDECQKENLSSLLSCF